MGSEAIFYLSRKKECKILSFVLLQYIRNYTDEFFGKKTTNLSKEKVKEYIENYGVMVNDVLVKDPNYKLIEDDYIEVEELKLAFICLDDESNKGSTEKNVPDIEEKESQNNELVTEKIISNAIARFLADKYSISNISDALIRDPKERFYIYFHLIKVFGIEQVKIYDNNNEIISYVKKEVKSNDKFIKELNIQKKDLAFTEPIISHLLRSETEKIDELLALVHRLEEGLYDSNLFLFLKDYSIFLQSMVFQYIISPRLNENLYHKTSLSALIKPVNDARTISGIEEKFKHYELCIKIFEKYREWINDENELNIAFHRISDYLLKMLRISCETLEPKMAKLEISPTSKKYNFNNKERNFHDIFLIIDNVGEGIARDVKLSTKSKHFIFSDYTLGIIKPTESREITIPTKVNNDRNFQPILNLSCEWRDIYGKSSKSEFQVGFQIQDLEVPWDDLERQKPYSFQAIEDKNKLFGRDEILQELSKNIYSSKIESYKLWGQKRVGKSSIVKTLKSLFVNENDIIVIYRSMSGLKSANAVDTLNDLGESLCSEIFDEINFKISEPIIREQLRSVPIPEFKGSLYPLEKYINNLKKLHPEFKFIFILDEFDRINDEFFLPGTLGETLSLNIGKGINEYNYIGFILVGSENMHLLDRQGINYNSYQEREVDTFDKSTEFDSFQKIITGPVSPYIAYSSEAIDQIFTLTNGNPYFSNLICSYIFKISFKNKDNEVDLLTTNKAIELIVNSSQKLHFEHFWSDGITEESNIRRERKADIRKRILISYSFSFSKQNEYPQRHEIVRGFKFPSESAYDIQAYEIENAINEFFTRKIFSEDERQRIRIKPNLFEQWLCGPGRSLMIEGVSDLEALQREKEIEEEYSLKENELTRLSDHLLFRGEKKSLIEYKKYFSQFGGAKSQRRVFKILDSVYYLTKDEITGFFKSQQRNIFVSSEYKAKIGARTVYREGIELYTFSETLNENIEVLESFKIISHIRKSKAIRDITIHKDVWKQNKSSEIIIFESIIDDYKKIQQILKDILSSDYTINKIPVKLVVLIMPTRTKAEIIKDTSSFHNFRLIVLKEVEDTIIKPFIDNSGIFETPEERGYAYAEVRKQFPNFNKKSLNVVFESHCPAVSLPILWCKTESFSPLFHNPSGKIDVEYDSNGEDRRNRIYYANIELSQKINNYIVNFLKDEAVKLGESDWFTIKLIPRGTYDSINKKYLDENAKDPRETYFDFLDYKEIVKRIPELSKVFMINDEKLGNLQLKWMDTLNELRRDPAHPEKPVPDEKEVEYFERIKDIMIAKLS